MKMKIIFHVLVVLLSLIQTAYLTVSCRDPEPFNLPQLRFTSSNITATSKFVLPRDSDILPGYGTLYKVPEHLINIRYDTELKLGECVDYRRRVFHEDLAHEPISVGSTCPWYYRKNIDENRLPNLIYDVECICANCIGHRFGRTCQKIYTYSNVFRRTGCLNGKYEYSTIVEPISVGCSCVRDPKPIGRQTMHT